MNPPSEAGTPRSLDHAFAQFVARLRPHLQEGDRVLDLACGSARLTTHLAGDPVRVFGLDTDASVVEDARLRGLPVQTGPAERLPFSDRSFEVVVARRVLHHSRSPASVVREALRTAARVVVFEEPGFAEPIAEEIDRLTKRWERRGGVSHFEVVPARRVAELAERSGGRALLEVECSQGAYVRFDLDAARDRYHELGIRVGTVGERRRFEVLLAEGRRIGDLPTTTEVCRITLGA